MARLGAPVPIETLPNKPTYCPIGNENGHIVVTLQRISHSEGAMFPLTNHEKSFWKYRPCFLEVQMLFAKEARLVCLSLWAPTSLIAQNSRPQFCGDV